MKATPHDHTNAVFRVMTDGDGDGNGAMTATRMQHIVGGDRGESFLTVSYCHASRGATCGVLCLFASHVFVAHDDNNQQQ